MGGLEDNGPRTVILALICIIFISLYNYTIEFTAPMDNLNKLSKVDPGSNYALSEREKPTLTVKSTHIEKGEIFDIINYVTAKDANGNDISSIVKMYSDEVLNTNKAGCYNVLFSVKSNGIVSRETVTFLVD